MKYHIDADDKRIASFENESDRDHCMDALSQIYDDVSFVGVND